MGKVQTTQKVLIITKGGHVLSCKTNECLLSREPPPKNVTNKQDDKKTYDNTKYHLYLNDVVKHEMLNEHLADLGANLDSTQDLIFLAQSVTDAQITYLVVLKKVQTQAQGIYQQLLYKWQDGKEVEASPKTMYEFDFKVSPLHSVS